MPYKATKHSPGLTFLEVITVLALISILSLVALGRGQMVQASLPTAANVLKAHLRYAQSRALNGNTAWGIRYDAGNKSYWLFNSDASATHRPLPGEESDSVDLAGRGLSITNSITNSDINISISFDGWGRPCSDDAGASPLEDADLTLTLGDTGGNTRAITITKNTGFIP
jgi:prepilin-type N-terminal cleavage/methylation domain-containing protein